MNLSMKVRFLPPQPQKTLWKDRDYALIPARVSTSWYRNWIYVGSSPTERATLSRERKKKDVTVIGAVEIGTKPGSTKPD